MKLFAKYPWLYLAAIVFISACHHHNTSTTITDSTVTTTSTTILKHPVPQTLVAEGFEQGDKGTYIGGNVTFKSGDWYLGDALIGGSKEDAKNGNKSIRIRNNGRLAMQFDIKGATTVRVSYAVYSHDKPSAWQLWASTDGGNTYNQIDSSVTVSNHTLQQATFSITLKGEIRFEIRKTSGGKNRINIDDFTITSGSTQFAGGGQPTAGDNSNLLLGNPSNATNSTANADNYLIDHQYYIESYNRNKAEPNWVCWHIGANDLGSTDRLNNFRPDSILPYGWLEVDPTFYKDSGFDKGHNCPSGDRTSSTAANSATFLMDNMIPQAPNNNQHTWEHFESYCRNQVKEHGNEVYIIMGSYGSGGTGRNGYTTSINNGRINVPAHIWKVAIIIPDGNNDLYRINTDTRIIAINTPNDNSLSQDWMTYVCTVSDIEKATGYQLLSALPASVRNVLETEKFSGGY